MEKYLKEKVTEKESFAIAEKNVVFLFGFAMAY